MRLKAGVRLTDMTPQILLAMLVTEQVYEEYGFEVVITSINDGTHSVNSLHYLGRAVDVRVRDPHGSWSMPGDIRVKVVDEITRRLGDNNYDIILESDHIHEEYDPK